MSSIRTPLTVSPHEYFGDITGRPLDYGTIYFGEPDKDPEFYPIDVYSDEALTQPIPQPIRTKGGFINVNGDIIEIYGRPAIYSVKVLDQYGRKIFYKGKAMRNNVNDDIIAEIDAAIQQSKDDGVEYAKKAVREAVNKEAVEGGEQVDTFVVVTPKFDGAIARTQAEKNSERASARDFGDDLQKAGEWVRKGKDRYCYLEPEKTYTLPENKTTYLNRLVCENGMATIVIPADANIVYANNGDPEYEVLHLEGLDIIKYGNRTSASNISTKHLYSTGSANVRNATIKNIKYTTPHLDGDRESWVDDTGRTRGPSFISYYVHGKSLIEGVQSFGAYAFATVRAGTNKAVHIEKDVVLYNCETGFFFTGDFAEGVSDNLRLINTVNNQSYYRGSDVDEYPNGCDLIMSEANHTEAHRITNLYTENALERAIYTASDNIYLNNIVEVGGNDAANIKHDAAVSGSAAMDRRCSISNAKYIVSSSSEAGYRCNGYSDAAWSNIQVASDDKVDIYGFTSSGGETLTLDGFVMRNLGGAVLVNNKTEYVKLSNGVAYDSFNKFSTICFNTTSSQKIKKGELYNIRSVITNFGKEPNKVTFPTALVCGHAEEMIVDGCVFQGARFPLHAANVDRLSITNTLFEFCTDSFTFNFFNVFFNKYEDTQLTNSATVFDFKVKHSSLNNSFDETTTVRFKRDYGNNKVPIVDYWCHADITVNIKPSTETAASNLLCPVSPALPSVWKVKARFKNSYVEFIADSITKTMTQTVEYGDQLTFQEGHENKLMLYYKYTSYSTVLVSTPAGFSESGDLHITYERLA